ncbi:Uncharacterised protein [Edwardsiella tarda]|nr:Uncharacterised protein [Edwardsiella tarda]
MTIDGDTADVILAGGDTQTEAAANGIHDLMGLCHDFWADAVAGQYGNMMVMAHCYKASLVVCVAE